MAACSWYINEDIVDINIFRASLGEEYRAIVHAPLPHVLTRRTQFGTNWPRKHVAQIAAFNFFENKDSKFRCTITLSRISYRRQWWFTACWLCHRMARPAAADAHTYVCGTGTCPSTAANVVYFIPVIASDQTGEAEFTLYGGIGEQAIGHSILLIRSIIYLMDLNLVIQLIPILMQP